MVVTVKRVLFLALGASVLLGGCDQIRESAGIKKKAPDEFAVLRNAPLSVPPSYDLRPPRAGARAVPQIDPRREAEQATFGRQNQPRRSVADSAGEEALLSTLRVGVVDEDIRRQVDEESAILAADNRNFVERLMFWREVPPPGTIVDPNGEERRIQDNAALGNAPTTGKTPTIERKTNEGLSLF